MERSNEIMEDNIKYKTKDALDFGLLPVLPLIYFRLQQFNSEVFMNDKQ